MKPSAINHLHKASNDFFKKSERTINLQQKYVNPFSLDLEVAFLIATCLNVFADLKPLPTIQTNLNPSNHLWLGKTKQNKQKPKIACYVSKSLSFLFFCSWAELQYMTLRLENWPQHSTEYLRGKGVMERILVLFGHFLSWESNFHKTQGVVFKT